MGKGDPYARDRGLNTMGKGVTISWAEGSKYHGMGVQYTMDRGFNIQCVGR